jgi:hypothetical protein
MIHAQNRLAKLSHGAIIGRNSAEMFGFEELKSELKEIADILNQFKSEAVQLKILEMLAGRITSEPDTETKQKRKGTRKRKGAKEDDVPKDEPEKQNRSGGVPRGSGGGAHAIIVRLLKEGFFDKPQTIGSITSHASERLGHHLKANECSPSLLRLLRGGSLTRSKNNDGQYEYTKA